MAQTADWLGQLPPEIRANAFKRSDLYGTYANNPKSFATQLRLIVLSLTLVPLKLFACIGCVLSYYLLILLGNATLSEPFKTKYMVFWGRFWTRAVLYCLGFWTIKWVYVSPEGTVSSKAPLGFKERRFGGYVSNHCSWVDIVLYMSRLFPSFVAKKEVSALPLVGPISKAMQCLFVDREARLASDKLGDGGGQGMSQLVKDRMQRKHEGGSEELPMLLFPEGTTTNNRFMLPFKRGAFVAGVPVQPLVLKYDTSGRFSPTWDSMPGHKHIFLTMTEFSYRVTCYVLPLYTPSEEEKADPALYAENVRQMMGKYGKIATCEDTFADKLAFFKYVTDRMAHEKGCCTDPAACKSGKAHGIRAGVQHRVQVEARAETEGEGLRHRGD
ncbi:hypothetical protein Agub_g10419 [Astrephomene gubernaculifera]|uniref:Phospholipid/glycerol acyltransferase domain-containing protein n=1 Tax=Astrephomene gubernaculifera TaxID=47775 RepID=A0AAD3DUT8_9CHLO|nr:hypothetical protein Agub_g10419 [Astrephomene gubernaculifera]